MRYWTIGAVAAGLMTQAMMTQTVAAQGLSPLVDPAQLVAIQEEGEALILDIRAAEAEAASYASGHVEGSVSAPYAIFRGPGENPGQLPSEAELSETLQGLGVETNRPTVIVYQGSNASDFGAAARVYWTLKSSGVSELAILNGGIAAWTGAGLELSTEGTTPEPSTIEVTFSDNWLASADDVQSVLSGKEEARLIDARPEAYYDGMEKHPAAERPGTLPKAELFEHSNWFASGPVIIDAAAAHGLAEGAGYAGDEQLISFCNTGHWAATNWFALSELAGIDNVRLYPESMVGWSNAGHEMANVPGPLQRIWLQIADAL